MGLEQNIESDFWISLINIKYFFMEIISCIVSIIALVVAAATYYFNLKAVNQNKIFDEKIKAYSKIATAIDEVILAFSHGMGTGKLLLEEKPQGYKEEFDALADEVNEAIYEMFDLLMANIILLPKSVYNHLDELATFMESEEHHNIFEKPQKIQLLLEELKKKQIAAIRVMRADLHSDQLNTRLHKRLGGNNIGHKIFRAN